MTMLLGGAKLLKGMEKDFKGTVKLFFQPAEEGGAGGKRFVEEGAPLNDTACCLLLSRMCNSQHSLLLSV